MRRARELDPFDATHHALSAQLAFTARDYPLFYAKDAAGLQQYFRFVTMSVTVRTKSQDANVVPDTAAVGVEAPTIDSRVKMSESTPDEDYW